MRYIRGTSGTPRIRIYLSIFLILINFENIAMVCMCSRFKQLNCPSDF